MLTGVDKAIATGGEPSLFLQGLLDCCRAFLLCNHKLEAVKVVHFRPGLLCAQLLCPRSLLPVSHDVVLLQGELQCFLASTTRDGRLEVSQTQTADGHHVPSHACELLRAINDDTLLVHNVNDCAHLASAWAIGDESQTARFHKALEHGCSREEVADRWQNSN